MEEKSELNDIILNKNNGVNGNKKIILVVATLGIILIVVVMLMNSLTSNGTNNLPQAVLPPEPKSIAAEQTVEEPLFEDIDVVEEEKKDSDNLDKIAQRLKEESKTEIVTDDKPQVVKKVIPPKVETKPEKFVKKQEQIEEKPEKFVKKQEQIEPKPVVTHQKQKINETSRPAYFIQVGSFSKYEPDSKFLKSLTDKGFKYSYHKVSTTNKVLVGPFTSEKDARDALRIIRTSIESGAFLVKI